MSTIPDTPQLILWRHAEAEDLSPFSASRCTPARRKADMERELTKRGRAQARRVAGWLRERLPKGTKVLASPALRCVETARALTRDFVEVAGLGPEHDCADLLAAIGWPELTGTVVLVGHQPTLGRVTAMMLTGREADWNVKKGAVWWFERRLRGHHAEHVLRAVMAPDLAKNLAKK